MSNSTTGRDPRPETEMNDDLDILITRYLDGTASAGEVEHLRECGDALSDRLAPPAIGME